MQVITGFETSQMSDNIPKPVFKILPLSGFTHLAWDHRFAFYKPDLSFERLLVAIRDKQI